MLRCRCVEVERLDVRCCACRLQRGKKPRQREQRKVGGGAETNFGLCKQGWWLYIHTTALHGLWCSSKIEHRAYSIMLEVFSKYMYNYNQIRIFNITLKKRFSWIQSKELLTGYTI